MSWMKNDKYIRHEIAILIDVGDRYASRTDNHTLMPEL
jgi:hypothetical protein